MEDRFDFDHIRLVSGDVERFVKFNFTLGNLANDAGLFSQADGVISRYTTRINFHKEIAIGGVY